MCMLFSSASSKESILYWRNCVDWYVGVGDTTLDSRIDCKSELVKEAPSHMYSSLNRASSIDPIRAPWPNAPVPHKSASSMGPSEVLQLPSQICYWLQIKELWMLKMFKTVVAGEAQLVSSLSFDHGLLLTNSNNSMYILNPTPFHTTLKK